MEHLHVSGAWQRRGLTCGVAPEEREGVDVEVRRVLAPLVIDRVPDRVAAARQPRARVRRHVRHVPELHGCC